MVQLKTHYEGGIQVNAEPLIHVFEDFLRPAETEALIRAAESRLGRALVSDSGAGVESAGRSGRNCWIPHDIDDTVQRLCDRVAQLVGLPLEHAESLQVLHYGETQKYAPHFDAWDAGTSRGQRCMARGGQRLITCLLYLNEVREGGGTSFPKLDLEVRAIPGRMVLFHNCLPGSTIRHPASLHGGLPVIAGEKWACNFWFRELPYRTAMGNDAKARTLAGKRPFGRVV